MQRTYAVRYTLISMTIGLVFVIVHAGLDILEIGLPLTIESFQRSIGWGDLLVMTTPLSFGLFAFMAGRQRDRVDAQTRYLATINQLNRTLTRSLDLAQTLPDALNHTVNALRMDHGALYLFERDQMNLHAATLRLPEVLPAFVERLQLEQWLPMLLPRAEGEQLVTLDLSSAANVPTGLQQNDYRQLVSVLIQSEGESLGLLLIISRHTTALTSELTGFITTAAAQIGAAVARTQPYAEIRRRARDLDAVAQVNRTLLAGMGLDDLLNTLVNAAQVRFGLPYVAVMWVDKAAGEFFIRAQAGPLAATASPNHRQKLTEGLSARVYRTGQPYLASDVRSEPDYISASDAPVLSSLLTPMKVSGNVIGIMAFDSLALDGFSEADVAALTTLTDQVTIAAENARLYSDAQRERRRIAAILRSTRDVVMLIDPAGLVQLLNPAAERVLGISASDGVNTPIEQVLTEPALREAYQWSSGRSSDEDSPPREVLVGNNTVYLFTVTTARDEVGASFGRVIVMQDISYLKQLDQFRTQMLQMASHDLRNPLGVAMGYLDVLNTDLQPLSALRQQVLSGIEAALMRMQNLIKDLLDMERIEAGADRRREPVPIDQLTLAVAGELREQAIVKRQTLELALAADLPVIIGDPVRLKQALLNLIGNAIKYTPDNGRIWVRLSTNDQHVVFEVQDTGYGISKTAQTRLFQRFYRVKARGTEHIDGTGLGLSLVKSVIDQHGGRITVDSDEGRGSTFRVELPITSSS